MNLSLVNKQKAKAISPARLEELFAAGLTNNEVAELLKLSPSYLSRRIIGSAILTDARKRGIRRSETGGNL